MNHVNWVEQYKAVRGIMDITYPGYMIHESGVWSDIHSKWFFLPRRCSKNRYNETTDETMGCNVLITADANFSKIEMITVSWKKSNLKISVPYRVFFYLLKKLLKSSLFTDLIVRRSS